ncbi:hypothetical protein BS639_09720 [Rouxiella silvae]|uniref:Uncharacterized protein n=1 Tax=Rouxiella silvae TaxID=1646373 RepID=A0AA40X3R6_9GAMM|nr:hypothetical protein [Rouxiella silvae]KQN46397.1 hypothetical protein ASE93_14080 [Serratia sp. Leaf50]MBF6638152.1 hypothetical protein [Rouxiella silvae]ORJ21442.1 hypothetical protein BS639_09720 [Rouxiella silvae]
MLKEKLATRQQSDMLGNASRGSLAPLRVICSNTKEHSQVISLYKLGLSCQAIATITGFHEEQFQHFFKS